MGEESCTSAALVSIVVPVYNGERYLERCLDSLLGQTYENIELVCVDDGSTDGSGELLATYAERDSRVRVITQENAGPGRARNVGMDAAQGRYLYFFDDDDWCESCLVERAVDRLESTNAQIVAFPFFAYDERVGVPIAAPWACLSEKYPQEVFDWHLNPDWLFRSFQNLPWNKMMRMDFVRSCNLRFQEDVVLTEDLMFSAPALAQASRITCLNDMLVYHREGTGTNVMSSKDKHPLDFITAFRALKGFLEEHDLFEPLRIAYVNWAMDGIIYNVHTLNTYEGFCVAVHELTEGGALQDLGILDVRDDEWHEQRYGEFVRDVCALSTEDMLYDLYVQARNHRDEVVNRLFAADAAVAERDRRIAEEQERAAAAEARIAELEARAAAADARAAGLERDLAARDECLAGVEQELQNLRAEFDAEMNAAEQKVGRAVCWVPRQVQAAMLRRKS